MIREKTTSERGKFKSEIHTALYKNNDLKELLLGNTDGMTQKEVISAFKSHVKSHLFIDDTIKEAESFIFYDIRFPYIEENLKTCQIVMYAICHRSILENYSKEGYYGDRSDILIQMIEDSLVNNNDVASSFGIGKLDFDSIDIYNSSNFYGAILTFSIPAFR